MAGAGRPLPLLEALSPLGTVLRSTEEPRRFSSFGLWASIETIVAMCSHPGPTAAIGKLRALCEEAELGIHLVETKAGEAPRGT
jgi:hypothetical protein